jgi:hypothetical protein
MDTAESLRVEYSFCIAMIHWTGNLNTRLHTTYILQSKRSTTKKIGGDTQGARGDGAGAAHRTQGEVASEEVNHMDITKRTNRHQIW